MNRGSQNRFQRPDPNREIINERIQSKEVRLIGAQGEQFGVLSTEEALKKAREKGLDLVLIVPTQKPPVAKIINYSKYRFEQEKQRKENKKKNKAQSNFKEIKLSLRIETHDFQVKEKKVLEWLGNGSKVRVVVEMRGRELQHKGRAEDILRKILDKATELQIAKPDFQPPFKREGRSVAMVLVPLAAAVDK